MPAWKKLTDRQEFPPGLADLIQDAYLYVHDGVEYAAVFVHDQGRCWYAFKSTVLDRSIVQIRSDPDTAMKEVEVAFLAGLIKPRRTARV